MLYSRVLRARTIRVNLGAFLGVWVGQSEGLRSKRMEVERSERQYKGRKQHRAPALITRRNYHGPPLVLS